MKQYGGVFGRSPTFNDVEADGYLRTKDGTYVYATDFVADYGR
jgi:hypothetical protein